MVRFEWDIVLSSYMMDEISVDTLCDVPDKLRLILPKGGAN